MLTPNSNALRTHYIHLKNKIFIFFKDSIKLLYILLSLCLSLKSFALNSDNNLQNSYTQELLLAEFAISNQEPSKALKIYQEITIKTQSPEIAQRATELALEMEQDQEALKTALIWADGDKDSAKAQLIASLLLMQYKTINDAKNYLERLYTNKADNMPAYIELVINHPLKPDNLEELKQKLIGFTTKDALKNNEYLLLSIALLYDKNQEGDKSIEYINKTLNANPKLQEAHIQKIRLLNIYKSTDEALSYLDSTVSEFPDNYELRKLYADILFDLENWGKAKKHYNSLAKHQLYKEDALLQLAYIHITNNDINKAKKILNKLNDSEKYSNIANYYLGLISEQLAQPEEALQYFKKVDGGEYHIRSLIRRASIHTSLKQSEEAQKVIDRALATIENEPNITTYLKEVILSEAELLYQQGLFSNAMSILNNTKKHYPDDPDIIYSIGILANQLKDPDLFVTNMKFVIKNTPNNSKALSALGWHYYESNDIDQSFNLLKEAYEKNDIDSKISARYAAILWIKGEHKQADQIWQKAIKLDPQNQALRDMIEKTKNR